MLLFQNLCLIRAEMKCELRLSNGEYEQPDTLKFILRFENLIFQRKIHTNNFRNYCFCSGSSISVDCADREFLRFIGDICGGLFNDKLHDRINGAIESELTILNVIDRLRD
jgi:hypothetical protein